MKSLEPQTIYGLKDQGRVLGCTFSHWGPTQGMVCVFPQLDSYNCALGTLMSSHSITVQFSQQPHYDRYDARFSNIGTHTQEGQWLQSC